MWSVGFLRNLDSVIVAKVIKKAQLLHDKSLLLEVSLYGVDLQAVLSKPQNKKAKYLRLTILICYVILLAIFYTNLYFSHRT